MATARAEKTPMSIQNRVESTLVGSFAARDVATDVPVLLLNQPIVWVEGGREKGSERRTHFARVTMEVCTVNSLLYFLAQNLTCIPKFFDPDCSLVSKLNT